MKTLYNYLAFFLIVGMLAASMGMKRQGRPAQGSGVVAVGSGKSVVCRGDR